MPELLVYMMVDIEWSDLYTIKGTTGDGKYSESNRWSPVWCGPTIEGGLRVWKSGRARETAGVSHRKENTAPGEVRGTPGGHAGKWMPGRRLMCRLL